MTRPLRLAALLLLLCRAPAADALELRVGMAHVRGLGADTAIHTDIEPSAGGALLGTPESFDSPGIALDPESRETLAVSFAQRLGERLTASLDLGVPPRIGVRGSGVAQPPGPAGATRRIDLGDPALHPLVTLRQWSPALSLQYRPLGAVAGLQPFVAAGVTYTWLTSERVNPAFAAELDEQFGQPLAFQAGKPGPTHSSVDAEPFWAPVLGLGLTHRGAGRLGWGLALAYAPLDFSGTLTLAAADGTPLSHTRADVRVHGLVAAAFVSFAAID